MTDKELKDMSEIDVAILLGTKLLGMDKFALATKWFDPINKDVDCMMVWKQFCSQGLREAKIAHLHRDGHWNWYAYCKGCLSVNKDMNRAMCECMVKAVA